MGNSIGEAVVGVGIDPSPTIEQTKEGTAEGGGDEAVEQEVKDDEVEIIGGKDDAMDEQVEDEESS